jgi:hypothetical protein
VKSRKVLISAVIAFSGTALFLAWRACKQSGAKIQEDQGSSSVLQIESSKNAVSFSSTSEVRGNGSSARISLSRDGARSEEVQESPANTPHAALGSVQSASKQAESIPQPQITDELISDLQNHTWSGGGFHRPDTPGFDELFREQRRKTAFTYTDEPLVGGVYLGDFGQDAASQNFVFTISLTPATENQHSGFTADWIQWKHGTEGTGEQGKIPLNDFKSVYADSEIYFGFLHLPSSVLQGKGNLSKPCPELLVIRHFDWSWGDHTDFVDFFNARVYCRSGLDHLSFIGRMGFKYLIN